MSTSAGEMEFEAAHYSNPEMEEEWEIHGVTPYNQTTLEVNIVHLASKPFQIRWVAHTQDWNEAAWCYTHPQ
jgi:hypothetical protein